MESTDYTAHTAIIAKAADAAIAAVQERWPEEREDLYIVSLSADGQYWSVTVGYANARDHVVEVETDEGVGTVTVLSVQ